MLIDKLKQDLMTAMRSQDKVTLSVIRMTKAAIERQALDLKRELTEEEVISIINKQIKTRQDSIVAFKEGNREDLIAKTQSEINILDSYMPTPLSLEEVETIISQVINDVGASSVKDLGLVMKALTPLVKGRFDMSKITELVRKQL